jgi:peptide/nickel transport system substrate-binding protein
MMFKYRKRVFAATAAVALAAGLAACGGSGGSSSGGGNGNSPSSSATGGTLNYFLYTPIEHLDPQRVYVGRDITNLSRTVYRSLVTFPISSDPKTGTTPVPDLATDTGTSTEGGKTWSFTVKNGVKWEDGQPITCEDFKYGASRAFATDVITGGPNYILSYLDIPTDPKTGLPAYDGPYKNDGKQYFDKAITCKGNTITYHFNKPWPDFPLAIAALHMMDPYRKDKDQGAKSDYQIFSSGPYKLQGSWSKNKGGTFVRNPNYDPSTDSPDNRKALPDEINFQIGLTPETQYDRLIADSGDDQTAITGTSVPPAYYNQIQGAIADRSVLVNSPYVYYLVPNFKSPTMSNPAIRKALAVATNVNAYVAALGGDKAAAPAESIVAPSVVGYKANPAFSGSNDGDPAAAKKILQDAGVSMPVKIKYTYPTSDTADKTAAALKDTWDKAGFDVTLDGLGDVYYTVIQKPDKDSDVMWAGWGADWPSAITVTAPLFDSRPNITSASVGQDYGAYKSDAFNKDVDEAQHSSSLDQQTAALQKADEQLGKDVAYIPLDITKFYMLYGSKVTNYTTTPSSNGYPDLGAIGVKS